MSDVQWEIAKFEERFDRAQAELRRAASTWVLAVFAGLGLLFTVNPQNNFLGISVDMIGTLIAYIGCVGMVLLWLIDQNVYQRLLHAIFTYGLHEEYLNEDLPRSPSISLKMPC